MVIITKSGRQRRSFSLLLVIMFLSIILSTTLLLMYYKWTNRPQPIQRDKKPRQISLQDHILPWYLLRVHVAYCEKYQFMICAPAKAASSEVLRWMGKVCDGIANTELIKEPYADPRLMPKYSLNNKFTGKLSEQRAKLEPMFRDWTILTVVRDPWQRLVSGYHDKFDPTAPHPTEWECEVMKLQHGIDCAADHFDNRRLSFDDFLKYVAETPDANDKFEHFSTQEFACPSWLEPDYVIHQEQFTDEIQEASIAMGLDDTDHKNSALWTKKRTVLSKTAQLTQEHFGRNCSRVEIVRKRFQVDIDRFGYKAPACTK